MEVKSLLMVMATLTIAGCSQNEMTENESGYEPDNRVGRIYGSTDQRNGNYNVHIESKCRFRYFAYQTSSAGWNSEKGNTTPNFMYNEHATWTSG